jgi:hypothetical protein
MRLGKLLQGGNLEKAINFDVKCMGLCHRHLKKYTYTITQTSW